VKNYSSAHLGIEGSAVSSLINSENLLDPCDDFVRGRIRGFIEVDYARANVGFEVCRFIRTAAVQKVFVSSHLSSMVYIRLG
jgi:hypothetical protein